MLKFTQASAQAFLFRSHKNVAQSVQRTIYTLEQLSVDKYVKERQQLRMSLQPGSIEQKRIQLQRHLRQKSSAILLNDFTHFMYFLENTDDDLALLEKILDKFKGIRIENLRKNSIGSIVMKMLHHFHRDDLAQKFYSDPILRDKFFNGKQSSLIFFDLLYKQKKYAELLRYFEDLRERLEAKQYPITRSIYILVFATCYNQDTEQSFAYAKQLDDRYKDAHITQDHLIFLSALALNQNAPNVAEQLLSTLWPTAHEAIASLRLLAMIQMRKFVNALKILRSIMVVYDENLTPKVEFICSEVIQEADNVFKAFCEDERLRNDFQELKSNLKTHGYTKEKNLRGMVFEPFKSNNMTKQQKNRVFLHAAFDGNKLI